MTVQDLPSLGSASLSRSSGRRAVLAVWLAGLALFAAAAVQSRVPVGYLTRDPSATAEEAWYLGLTSSLGVIGWTVGAAVFGFGAILTRNLGARSTTVSLVTGSAVTAMLLIDDLFLVHDDILLRALGSEKPVLATYAAVFAGWLYLNRRRIGPAAFLPLAAAVTGFAISVVVDRLWDADEEVRLLVEDGTKFVGIWCWVVFAAVFTLDQLKRVEV